MWLITSFLAATAVCIWAENLKAYHLDWLCLMLWGLSLMVLVDHSIGFVLEGGEFIEVMTEGYIESGTLLGVAMLIPIFIVWGAVVLISKGKRETIKKTGREVK